MRRFASLTLFALAVTAAITSNASSHTTADWKVQASKSFQKIGEYTIRASNTRFADAIAAWGDASSCQLRGSANHAIANWAPRGIRVELWTYGALSDGEDGCTAPEQIFVSEIRLTDRRWTTALGLHVGDTTSKLRRLYPKATYQRRSYGRGSEYWLVTKRSVCIGQCTSDEDRNGVDTPRLTAQIQNGRILAFWVPVFGQGE